MSLEHVQMELDEATEAAALANLQSEELEEVLIDVVDQSCSHEGMLDSQALSAYAVAIRLLAKRGHVKIERDVGRRVIGRWV